MNPDISLYENLKALIKLEQESGTACIYSEFALELLRTLDEQKEIINCANRNSNYDEEWRAGYNDAARSEAADMWGVYSDFYGAIM